MPRNMAPKLIQNRPQDVFPLVVHKLGRIVPCLDMRIPCHIGPGVMAVRREMETVRFRTEKPREMRAEIEHGANRFVKAWSAPTRVPERRSVRALREGRRPPRCRPCRAAFR